MATTNDLPREPSAWMPSLHFPERFHDRYEDNLDGEIVEGCIRDGTINDECRSSQIVWFRETFGGVTYRLVLDTRKREVVTGYPISINTEVAEASGRWSPSQIEDIREFIATDPREERV